MYNFEDHSWTFFDIAKIYQNYAENISGVEGIPPTLVQQLMIDEVIDSYNGINSILGFDYKSTDREVYKAYANEYLKHTNVSEKDLYIVLGTIEAGLAKHMITTPKLNIQGRNTIGDKTVLESVEEFIGDFASGTGEVVQNLGKGIVNTSDLLRNLPLVVGSLAVGYYFFFISPKHKG